MAIDSLTEEQWADLRDYRESIIASGRSTEPFTQEEIERCEEGILWLYKKGGLEPPEIIWADGPSSMQRLLVLLRREAMLHGQDASLGEKLTQLRGADGKAGGVALDPPATKEEREWAHSCLSYEHWWLGIFYHYLYVNKLVENPVPEELRRDCEQWVNAHSSLSAFLSGVAVVCRKPIVLTVNRAGLLHNESGPAWAWADGTEIYALDGVRLPPWVIVEPPNPARILRELRNAEQRRVVFNFVGWEYAIAELGLEPLDAHDDPHMGTLYALPENVTGGDSNLLMARNGSPHENGEYQMYGLLCSPDARTVEEAQASLAGISVEEMRELEGRA